MEEKLEATAAWWRQIRERNNEKFLPLLFDEHRYLVLKGGGGSGKSIFAGVKILERAATEEGHRFLVVRKVARTLRESCFEQLRDQAYTWYGTLVGFIPRGKSGDMYIRMANGSEILFAGLDDVEKLKSIYDITGIWVEEASEITQSDFNQLDIRLRTETPHYLQMILTFNPVSVTHWLKERFFDREDPRALVHETTYRDNRFLSREAVETLESFRDSDAYYYQVYCLGEWGVTGRTVFDGAAVTAQWQRAKEETPKRRGIWQIKLAEDRIRIAGRTWSEEPSGPITVWKEPEEGRPYVIGADTAGDGSDWFVAHVLDNTSGEQVCTLRCRYDEDAFTRQLYCLGMWYNNALIGVECNFSTYPAKLLEMMGYTRQFVRTVEDTFTGQLRHAYGVRTDAKTRPVMIGDLVRLMRDHVGDIHDVTTLEEMLSFVRNEEMRPEAEPGAHDDCVMALAISYYIRPQQRSVAPPAPEKPKVQWTKSMKEDYRRATAEERAYLREKWGRPDLSG